ncbi:sodium:solute symporter family protein [Carboxylicivirga sp. RSCT41]|uniref:sodium:solute symporter family protein n=1 Tax=Carboxylicivirga agarovorans TaxID=3417570 RepID=UPI003D33F66A
MSTIDILAIVLFMVIVFMTGMAFSKASGNNMKSFFAADGAVPWWMNGLSLFMSFFSAGTFVVWGAIAYADGLVSVSIQWTMCIAGIIIGIWIAPKWQKTKILTVAEYITKRLGLEIQKTYTLLFLGVSIFTAGGFLYPVAKIVEVWSGIPAAYSIIVIGAVMAIYTAVGGLWAVVVTGVLQFIVLLAAVIIVVPLSIEHVGGMSTFFGKVPEGFMNFTGGDYSWGFLLAFGLYNLFFIAGNWAFVQRYTTVSSPKEAKKVGWMFGALYTISPLLWMLPPMLYRVVDPSLSGLESEEAYMLMCKTVLPVGMLGLIVGGMVFATSSSINTTLNISAGVITNDIYKRLFPHTSDLHLVKIGKLATLAFGALTIGIALLVPLMGGIVNVILTIASLTGAAMFLPPLWTLFSKRQTGFSVLFTTIASLVVNLFMKFISPLLFDITLSRANEMILGVALPIALLMVFEMVNKAKGVEYIEETPQTSQEDEVSTEAAAANIHGIKVMSWGIIAVGILLSALGAIADSSKLMIIGVASVILLLGIVMLVRSKKNN